jgi:hypothetical protein
LVLISGDHSSGKIRVLALSSRGNLSLIQLTINNAEAMGIELFPLIFHNSYRPITFLQWKSSTEILYSYSHKLLKMTIPDRQSETVHAFANNMPVIGAIEMADESITGCNLLGQFHDNSELTTFFKKKVSGQMLTNEDGNKTKNALKILTISESPFKFIKLIAYIIHPVEIEKYFYKPAKVFLDVFIPQSTIDDVDFFTKFESMIALEKVPFKLPMFINEVNCLIDVKKKNQSAYIGKLVDVFNNQLLKFHEEMQNAPFLSVQAKYFTVSKMFFNFTYLLQKTFPTDFLETYKGIALKLIVDISYLNFVTKSFPVNEAMKQIAACSDFVTGEEGLERNEETMNAKLDLAKTALSEIQEKCSICQSDLLFDHFDFDDYYNCSSDESHRFHRCKLTFVALTDPFSILQCVHCESRYHVSTNMTHCLLCQFSLYSPMKDYTESKTQ